LQKSDSREKFESNNADLDYFFKRYAGQNQFKHYIGITYIATDEKTIFGYMTIAMGSIEAKKLPKKQLPEHYPLPILRLGRLAVDIHFQGKGIGSQLLRHALLLALHQKKTVGCVGVVVDAKMESIAFYQKLGFEVIEQLEEGEIRSHPPPQPMFLPIKSIAI